MSDQFGIDSETGRGFPVVCFLDIYGEECSLQISSAAVFENEDGTVDDPLGWVWLGIDDVKPRILMSDAQRLGLPLPAGEVSGWMDYPVPSEVFISARMHLSETHVRGLIERLQTWLDTGQFKKGGEA